jgi:hypothetical protein
VRQDRCIDLVDDWERPEVNDIKGQQDDYRESEDHDVRGPVVVEIFWRDDERLAEFERRYYVAQSVIHSAWNVWETL